MNEQIKAIGRQAGLVFIEDGVYGQRWYSSKCGLDASEYEKLVELIVKECVECADIVGKANLATAYPNSTAHHVKQKIKQRFGVQE
jgi:hypothetical protein